MMNMQTTTEVKEQTVLNRQKSNTWTSRRKDNEYN